MNEREVCGSSAPQRERQVTEYLSRLRMEIDSVENTIEILANRLSLVLTLVPAQAAGEPKKSLELVPLASEIGESVDRILHVNGVLASFLQRLEI